MVRVVPMVRAIPAVSVVNTFRVVTYRPKMPRSMTPGPWLQVHGIRAECTVPRCPVKMGARMRVGARRRAQMASRAGTSVGGGKKRGQGS